jgi:RNA polymerase sigma factor (sigma-70 family)
VGGHRIPRNVTKQQMDLPDTNSALDDAALLRAARSDPDAFCVFYVRHARPLSAWLRVQVRDAETADELVAESFACALDGLHRFRGTEPREAVGWLYGIAGNLIRQWHRMRRVEDEGRRRVGMPVRSYSAGEDADEIDQRLDAEALGPALQEALAGLPADQRLAVSLRIVEGRPYDEIATALGLAEPAIRKRVSRALESLNSRLKGAGA